MIPLSIKRVFNKVIQLVVKHDCWRFLLRRCSSNSCCTSGNLAKRIPRFHILLSPNINGNRFIFQLLRRELGAELGSVVESIRRYIQRGTRTTSSAALPSPGSAATTAAAGSTPQKSSGVLTKADEQFIKLISTVVQKAFK